MGSLDGQVAFITGAARGQGRAHAIRLASEGADVILSDICGPVSDVATQPRSALDEREQTVKAVEALGRRVVWDQVDVRDLDAMCALADRGAAELGHLDI